jgi:hypothetical protein
VIDSVPSPRWGVVVGLALLAMLGTGAGGCQGSKPEATAEQTGPDTAASDAMHSDTTASDTMADADSNDGRPGPIAPGPAPGTVRVEAVVESCDTTASPVQCRLQIEKILGYGSSTPTLSKGMRTVRFASGLLEEQAVDALRSTSHIFVLSHAGPQPEMGAEEGQARIEWTAQSVEQK